MRYWDHEGKPGADGRLCLVMDPEDGTNPIRTYGRTMDEVLDKVARTAEAAQKMINRQRAAAPSAPAAPPAERAATRTLPPVSADEQMQATADLQNPAKAPAAMKTLLRANGVDVEQMAEDQNIRRTVKILEAWTAAHPDFPADERNQRQLMNTAVLRFGKFINAMALDAAYQELIERGMLFESHPENTLPNNPPMPPDGNPVTRIERPRGASSFRSSTLRATAPGARQQPKYTRAEIDQMNSKQLREKIDHEPGFADWYNREFSASATGAR
jgi:hypothetical protein